MNKETKTPEPLSAILAEMRADVADGENAFFVRADWLALCDRLEAAAEREREMAKGLSKKLDENRAITGNAAALRDALKAAQALLLNIDFDADGGLDDDAAPVMANIGHALAAPARNADRFATEMEAFEFYLAHTPDNGNIIDGFPTWLYATTLIYGDAARAEGGAE